MLLERGQGIAEHSRATLAACSHTTADDHTSSERIFSHGRSSHAHGRQALPTDHTDTLRMGASGESMDGEGAAGLGLLAEGLVEFGAGERGYRSQGSSPRKRSAGGSGRSSSRPASACGYRGGDARARAEAGAWGPVGSGDACGAPGGVEVELRRLAHRLQALPGRLPAVVKSGPAWERLALQISDVALWQVRAWEGVLGVTEMNLSHCSNCYQGLATGVLCMPISTTISTTMAGACMGMWAACWVPQR